MCCDRAMDRQTGSSDEERNCLDEVLATKSSEKSCATHYLKFLLLQERAAAKTTLSELSLNSNRCLFMSVKLKSCNSWKMLSVLIHVYTFDPLIWH